MKKVLIILLICIFYLSTISFSLDKNIDVSIAKFNIRINDTTIDNTSNKYPFIVYKDITYLPMTWDYCNALRLAVNFDNKKGLNINKSNSSSKVSQDLSAKNNLNIKYKALKPSFKIYVNGKTVNNIKEKYPILTFRDITYFPLTWRFAVEEFGWEYSYNSKDGLCIKSNINNNRSDSNPKKEYSLVSELKDYQKKRIQDEKLVKIKVTCQYVDTGKLAFIRFKDINKDQYYSISLGDAIDSSEIRNEICEEVHHTKYIEIEGYISDDSYNYIIDILPLKIQMY